MFDVFTLFGHFFSQVLWAVWFIIVWLLLSGVVEINFRVPNRWETNIAAWVVLTEYTPNTTWESGWACSSDSSLFRKRSLAQLWEMQESLESLVGVLESYRGRDKIVSIYLYCTLLPPVMQWCWKNVNCIHGYAQINNETAKIWHIVCLCNSIKKLSRCNNNTVLVVLRTDQDDLLWVPAGWRQLVAP